MPKGDFGDRLPISNQDSRSALDTLSSFFLMGAVGCAVYLGVERLGPLDEAVLGRHSKNHTSQTEIMGEEPVEELPEESKLLQTWTMLTELDRAWIDSLIERALK